VAEATRLFAERGYEGTSMGDLQGFIEERQRSVREQVRAALLVSR
jgi:hypothetical protein